MEYCSSIRCVKNIFKISPEHFAEQLSQDLNLPPDFIHLISLSIRKQIKEYVFDLFNTFTKRFVHLKEEHHKADVESRQITQFHENLSIEKKKTIPPKNSIFATYNANSLPLDTSQIIITKPWKNYAPPDTTYNFDDILPSPIHFLFDTKLENLIAAKPFNINIKTPKPEFLKNKVPRRSNRKLDETNFNISQSNLLYEYNIQPLEYIKKDKKPKPKSSLQSKHIKKKNSRAIDFNKLNSIEFRNPHILEIIGSAIVISKEVLSFSHSFEKIVIFKKDIEPFMNLQENKIENGNVKFHHTLKDENENKNDIKQEKKINQSQNHIEIENLIFSNEKNQFNSEEEKAFHSQTDQIKILELNGIINDEINGHDKSNGYGIYFESNPGTSI
jgi:hypothetical protein